MTAAAMIVGMMPMAIGGAGEEQNAVLARAVIGGLVVGTLTTLLFVPYLYSIIGRRDASGFAGTAPPARRDCVMNDGDQRTVDATAGPRARRPGPATARRSLGGTPELEQAAPRAPGCSGWRVAGDGAARRRRRLGACCSAAAKRSRCWRRSERRADRAHA